MKKLFLSLVAVMAATVSFAQSSLLATLSHEGTISTYYGASALREAHAAAANGDIITLSSGSFVSVDITKGITLRGAGWEVDEVNHSEPTVILGDFNINIPTETTERLTIEGIYHNGTISYKGTLQNATFLKSRFNTIRYPGTENSLKNATFIHCRISKSLSLYSNSSAACINCVIWNPLTYNSTSSTFECVNCVLYQASHNWLSFTSSSLKSCVLITDLSSPIPSSTTVFNCVGLFKNYYNGSSSNGLFVNVPNSTNTASTNSPFKTYTTVSAYNDSEKFELTDEAKTKYLGIDGTQVGLYGGTLPFSSTPTNPQITKCNVAAKSTADGKLSVDIEVSSAE